MITLLIIVGVVILIFWFFGNSLRKTIIRMENSAEDAYWKLQEVEKFIADAEIGEDENGEDENKT